MSDKDAPNKVFGYSPGLYVSAVGSVCVGCHAGDGVVGHDNVFVSGLPADRPPGDLPDGDAKHDAADPGCPKDADDHRGDELP